MIEVIKAIEFPDREFSSRKELFDALRENHDRIIKNKKSVHKIADSVAAVDYTIDQAKENAVKALESESFMRKGFVYPVINTTNYLDSHNDVHADGLWTKSASEQVGKILWVTNHALEIGAEIAYEKDVNIMVQPMTFKALGYDSMIKTQALIFEVGIDNIVNDRIADRIAKNIPTQHSIRMQYVNVLFAMNSDEPEDKEFKANFVKYIDSIANKDRAINNGYYYVVTEAKIISEGSSVIQGSNDITPMFIGKEIEPSVDTQSDEPSVDTHEKEELEKVSDTLEFNHFL